MANLAATYWNQGQLERAEKLEVEVIRTRVRILGEKHPNTMASTSNLAFTLKA
jgi:hypothetical protein